MRLSAPIYYLRSKAKRLAREGKIPLHRALDKIAVEQGYRRWSLLVAKLSSDSLARKLFADLQPGDLLLLGSRPGHGKTLLSLELAVEAMKAGRQSAFFTLDYSSVDVLQCFRAIGVEPTKFGDLFECDCSDRICADYIVDRMSAVERGTLIIIDYLQLLDQKRDNPDLSRQIQALATFAKRRGLIAVFITQIDRSFDLQAKQFPDLEDVRLPNPLDLTLFDKACFLNNGEITFREIH